MAGQLKIERPQDTVNRKALMRALLPFIASVLVFVGGYFWFFHNANEIRVYKMGAGPSGSDQHELLEAIARQVSLNNDRLRIELVTTSGSRENIRLLDKGDLDFAAIPSDALTRPNFSLVASLYPDTYHMIVRKDSGIKSIHDLEGRRIAVPPITSAAYRSFWFLIGQYGLSPEAMRVRELDAPRAFLALRSKQVDALFVMRPPGDKRIRWLTDAVFVAVLPIDQGAAMRVRKAALSPVVIPKGVYSGKPAIPQSQIASVAADRVLVTRTGLPDDVVRAMTAVMFENRRDLTLYSKLAVFIKQPKLTGGTILPVHPGAIAFYDRDQPTFLQENAEVIGVLFSIAAILFSASLWLKRRWEEGQKGRIDVYNLELAGMVRLAREADAIKDLDQLKTRLFDMLPEVIRDLDEDKIDGEGFQYFAFTWEATLAAVAERQEKLNMDV